MDTKSVTQAVQPDTAIQSIRPGITYQDLANQTEWRLRRLNETSNRHSRSSTVWRSIAGPLAWLAAVVAALAGLSLVTDNQQVAQGLSIATALIAATNAAVNPAETARRHRAAALAYQHLLFKISDVAFFEVGYSDTDPEGGGAIVPIDQLQSIRRELTKFDEETQSIDEGSPPLGPSWHIRGRSGPR